MRRTAEVDSLGDWLCKLLSLDGERATDRLGEVLDRVPKSSLSVEQIESAFLMYVDGKFPLEPRDNYLTVILFNKIINCYIQENNKKNRFTETESMIKPLTEADYKRIIKDEFENYKFSGELNANRTYLYDELKIEVADKFKKVAWKHSIAEVKKEQSQLNKRDRADKETLKAKCIIRYKQKLVALIFDKFTTYEQLKDKL